jgi:hypothetical protein
MLSVTRSHKGASMFTIAGHQANMCRQVTPETKNCRGSNAASSPQRGKPP